LRNTGPQPLNNEGNVDCVAAEADAGFAFVADGVGHDYATTGLPARQREKMNGFWQKFTVATRERILQASGQKYAGVTLDELQSILTEELQAVSAHFSGIGKSSTFSGALLLASGDLHGEDRRWVLSIGIADSGIVLLRGSDERAVALTSFSDNKLRNIEVGGDIRSLELQLNEVARGDVVLGLTDGTLDAMAAAEAVSRGIAGPSLAKEPERWMQECLKGVQAAAASAGGATSAADAAAAGGGGAATTAAEDASLDAVLEAIFQEALLATNANQLLQPDDCASFAFRVS
jgi:hypothetical protein